MKIAMKFLSAVVLTTLLVGAFALALPTGVFAQTGNPPAQPTQAAPNAQNQQERRDTRLETLFQRAQKQVVNQAKLFAAVDTRLPKLQARIDTLKSQGVNVAALEKAVADFKIELNAARTAHNAAEQILKIHAGFDANGKVTNAQLAKDTLQQATQLLKQARQDVRPSLRNLVQVIRQTIRANAKK